jgi:hypothetical protein
MIYSLPLQPQLNKLPKDDRMYIRKTLLCIPPVALCLLDQTVTLVGQPKSYWVGNYTDALEGNPWFNWLLQRHPLAFEAGIAAWILLFCSLILLMPRLGAMVISIAVVLGHTWGTATWLCWRVRHGYWLSIGLFLTSAILIVWTWETFSRKNRVEKPS